MIQVVDGNYGTPFPQADARLGKAGAGSENIGKVAEAAPLRHRRIQSLGHIKLRGGGVKNNTVDVAGIGNDRITEYLLRSDNV